MRVTLAASALMLAFAAPAQGADKEEWGYIKAGTFIQLSYGDVAPDRSIKDKNEKLECIGAGRED